MTQFTDLELDTLQEVMNIAFGQAAADLAQVVDFFVQLNAPGVNVISVPELPEHIAGTMGHVERTTVVEQQYTGETSGIALLFFPEGAEKQLLTFFESYDEQDWSDHDLVTDLEREVLMEIGNILIGACVSKLFELLNRSVTYLPPRAIRGYAIEEKLTQGIFEREDFAITMETRFSFEDRDISGKLFLVNRNESAAALKSALAEFWSQYQ